MKKLSKITESIWSDMQDRGAGDMIKKEDDINLLDGAEFAEYLKKLYKNVDTPFKIIFDVENVITVPIIKYKGQTICVHYDCANNIVYGRFDFLYYQFESFTYTSHFVVVTSVFFYAFLPKNY